MKGTERAGLGVHGTEVARKATGLEAAIVDHSLHRIAALDPADTRAFDVPVAGVASLMIAKLHKIAERKDVLERRQDKDGLDVLRLLRFADTDHLAGTLTKLAANPVAGKVTRDARDLLKDLFGERGASGAQMAVRASVGSPSLCPARPSLSDFSVLGCHDEHRANKAEEGGGSIRPHVGADVLAAIAMFPGREGISDVIRVRQGSGAPLDRRQERPPAVPENAARRPRPAAAPGTPLRGRRRTRCARTVPSAAAPVRLRRSSRTPVRRTMGNRS